jgi:uncharacterized protein (TIGR03083 family)
MTDDEFEPMVLAALAGADTEVPPDGVRSRLLAAALDRPRPSTPGADSLDVFDRCVGDLAALLAELVPNEWQHPARPYEWTVHGLVCHLLAIEHYTAAQLGFAPRFDDARESDHLEIGHDMVVAELGRPPAETAASWITRATGTIDRLRTGDGPGTDDPVRLHVWPFTRRTLLVARAFEVWTHADDIRRATGRPVVAPPATDLRTMSEASVRSLDLLVPFTANLATMPGARVVLTGPGGGTFDLGSGEREVTVVADVVDYCRLVARRGTASDLLSDVEGDARLADLIVTAAQAIAV